MATEVTNYKCPNCTGPLHFGGISDRLECDFCGSSFTIEYIEELNKDKTEQAAENFQGTEFTGEWSGGGEEWGEDGEHIRVYHCPSCSAELICDDTTAATSCPYCNNPTVVPGQLSGALKPDYIIPFRFTKEAAVAQLKEHYKGRWFLPKEFSAQNHIEDIKGVYVPFWLYNGVAEGDVAYVATRSHTRREGDYEVTTTEHYNIRRSGSLEFKNVPVDASTKMPDDHMDSIEPFDYSDMKDFSMAYLPGFLADKYDVSEEASRERAETRCENTVESALRNTVLGYESVMELGKNLNIRRGNVSYALMPVWMLTTKYKDKNYLFAMNGQTGKMAGDLPTSMAKLWGLFAAIGVPIAALLTFLFLR
ncbi:MAG: hypothetical protein IJ788_03740 [Oscillospiraceae bacterium]|nr:hypothetical protein [Oscillospiraceae bacterium]